MKKPKRKKQRKKPAKKLKKASKKQGAKKPKKPADPEITPEKPQTGGPIDLPTPGELPKSPPRAPSSRRPGQRGPDKSPRKPRTPPDQPSAPPPEASGSPGEPGPDFPFPVPELPPALQAETTPEGIKARANAIMITEFEAGAKESFLPPAMKPHHKKMIEDSIYAYCLINGGEIPPWLGLFMAHLIAWGPDIYKAWRLHRATSGK